MEKVSIRRKKGWKQFVQMPHFPNIELYTVHLGIPNYASKIIP